MTAYTVHPGHHVGHPDRGHWMPPPPPAVPVFFQQNGATPGPEVVRRVLEGLKQLD